MQRGRAGDDDEPGDHRGKNAADDYVDARRLVLPRGHAFLDDRRLQVELHPRRDRRPRQSDDQRQIAVVAETGAFGTRHRRQRRRFPVGMRENPRCDVGQVERRGGEKDLFDTGIRAVDDERPHGERRDRHDDVLRDAEQLEEASLTARRTVVRVMRHPTYGLGPGPDQLTADDRRELAVAGGLSSEMLRLL